MTLLIAIAFLGLIAGCFILLQMTPFEFARNISKAVSSNKISIREKVNAVQNKKKRRGFKKLIAETKEILKATGKKDVFNTLCIMSFALFIFGALLSITMNNMVMIPILATGFSILPFWYIKFTASYYKKQLNEELETALSTITTSYMRSENIINAIEENIEYINPPVQNVFRSFLAQTKLINSNIKLALEGLKNKIDNDVFREWIDALIDCQEDKNLKSTLTPIVSKLSDMRIVSAELEYLMYEPMKEFITLAILDIGIVPIMYFLNKNWYHTLVYTAYGKVALAISTLVLFVSLGAVIRLSKPVEYKR